MRLPNGAWVVTSLSTRPRQAAVATLAAALLITGLPLFGIVTTQVNQPRAVQFGLRVYW